MIMETGAGCLGVFKLENYLKLFCDYYYDHMIWQKTFIEKLWLIIKNRNEMDLIKAKWQQYCFLFFFCNNDK